MTLHSEVLTIPTSFAKKGIKGTTFRLGLPTPLHEKLKFLVELGFGGSEEMQAGKSTFVPRKVLGQMLSKFPVPDTVPDDCEVIRVDVSGTKSGVKKTVRLESIIHAHKEWKVSCGALDTGVPPSIVAQMIARGQIKQHGVLAPELCVPRKEFFEQLSKRQININKKELVLAR
jgi:saccharopine dehydrogenase-like NADP-dependent oxidoreductase